MTKQQDFSMWSMNFILFCLANFLYYGAFYLYIPVLPQYVEMLGGTPADIGLVGGAFGLSSFIIRPYLGKLANEWGRKRMMLLGTISFALLFLLFGRVTGVVPLVVLRLAHGVCLAMYLAASAAYIADYAPVDRRGEVLGIYQTCSVVSMAVFPAAGIWILQHTQSYPFLFNVTFVTALVCFFVLLPLKETNPVYEQEQKLDLLPIFRRRVIFMSSLCLLGASLVYGAILTFLPIYAQQRNISDYGIFFVVYALATMGSRVFAGKLSDHVDRRLVILPFSLLVALAAMCFFIMDNVWTLGLIAILFGLGYGALVPALTALVVDVTRPEERGPALGFFTEVGIVVGAMGLGFITEILGYANMFALSGIIVLVITLAFWLLVQQRHTIKLEGE
jgi:MFS family permease